MFLQNVMAITFLKPFKNVLKRFVLAGYISDLFCLHDNIRPGNITISLFFGALK